MILRSRGATRKGLVLVQPSQSVLEGFRRLLEILRSSVHIYIHIYIYMAKPSFSAYVLGKKLLETGEKLHFLTEKSTTNFGRPFCSFPFPLFASKMAKICCFCLSKRQKGRQKTRPPPYIYIYIHIHVYIYIYFLYVCIHIHIQRHILAKDKLFALKYRYRFWNCSAWLTSLAITFREGLTLAKYERRWIKALSLDNID